MLLGSQFVSLLIPKVFILTATSTFQALLISDMFWLDRIRNLFHVFVARTRFHDVLQTAFLHFTQAGTLSLSLSLSLSVCLSLSLSIYLSLSLSLSLVKH